MKKVVFLFLAKGFQYLFTARKSCIFIINYSSRPYLHSWAWVNFTSLNITFLLFCMILIPAPVIEILLCWIQTYVMSLCIWPGQPGWNPPGFIWLVPFPIAGCQAPLAFPNVLFWQFWMVLNPGLAASCALGLLPMHLSLYFLLLFFFSPLFYPFCPNFFTGCMITVKTWWNTAGWICCWCGVKKFCYLWIWLMQKQRKQTKTWLIVCM